MARNRSILGWAVVCEDSGQESGPEFLLPYWELTGSSGPLRSWGGFRGLGLRCSTLR